MFELGDTVQDKVTGYLGTITARKVHLGGREEFLVEGTASTTGENPPRGGSTLSA